jgi:hypothetical protein
MPSVGARRKYAGFVAGSYRLASMAENLNLARHQGPWRVIVIIPVAFIAGAPRSLSDDEPTRNTTFLMSPNRTLLKSRNNEKVDN